MTRYSPPNETRIPSQAAQWIRSEKSDEQGRGGEDEGGVRGRGQADAVDEHDLVQGVADDPDRGQLQQVAALEAEPLLGAGHQDEEEHGRENEAQPVEASGRHVPEGQLDQDEIEPPHHHGREHEGVARTEARAVAVGRARGRRRHRHVRSAGDTAGGRDARATAYFAARRERG